MEFTARNTNELGRKVYDKLNRHGQLVNTRNGQAIRFPGVTTITLRHPWERVNISPVRDANPFFHLIEAMAMLAGDIGNSVHMLSYFAKNMLLYSDDGVRYNAFYGTRMRESFGDQLTKVVDELRANPESRQALINLWDTNDLGAQTKDKACNLCMIFSLGHKVGADDTRELDMTTFNRSNDAIFGGVTGANVVHFSFFHEYVTNMLGWRVGQWHHSSANLHAYLSNDKLEPLFKDDSGDKYLYPQPHHGLIKPHERAVFDLACESFIKDLIACTIMDTMDKASDKVRHLPAPGEVVMQYGVDFIDKTVVPMLLAFVCRKEGDKNLAYQWLATVKANDWRWSGLCWMRRRDNNPLSIYTIDSDDLYHP